ncbi:MAG: helix-turn-helix transcriptional regulator [Bacteroidales bacterium]|nr:helix-turn-helix transcriptional regulator [Bacteroidales bacterium]
MNTKIKDFFYTHATTKVDNKEYKNIDFIKKTAKAITQTTGLGVYVFDYYKHEMLYISENIPQWFDIPKNKRYDCEYYLQFINKKDLKMLLEINNAAFEYWNNNSEKELNQFTVSYNFRFKGIMLNQHYAPILNHDNKIWFGLCTVSISSEKKPGHIIMDIGNQTILEYSLDLKKWIPKEKIILTKREKTIIRYSAQGYSVKEIAQITETSFETIKTHKKNIFTKLKVNTIAEAVRYAINNNML